MASKVWVSTADLTRSIIAGLLGQNTWTSARRHARRVLDVSLRRWGPSPRGAARA
jgi:hypothetical protein